MAGSVIIAPLMPRKNPVPEREKEICGRLREFRLNTKLSQVAFAHKVGLDSARLASYEHGRVPLRYRLAKQLFEEFDINLAWLAEGIKPMVDAGNLPAVASTINDWELFSAAYDRVLRDELLRRLRSGDAVAREFIAILEGSPSPAHGYLRLVKVVLAGVLAKAPVSLHAEFFETISDCAVKFWSERVKGSDQPPAYSGPNEGAGLLDLLEWKPGDTACLLSEPESGMIEKDSLTGYPGVTKVPPTVSKVISTWPELREELNKLTSERGTKAALARKFGVTPQAVSDWLREVYSPEADTVLKLLRWVENPQPLIDGQTNPGAVTAAPESKTQKKGEHEKRTQHPSPRKR